MLESKDLFFDLLCLFKLLFSSKKSHLLLKRFYEFGFLRFKEKSEVFDTLLIFFFEIWPTHTPGQRSIWALKHNLLCPSLHLSRYGKILRIILSASFSSPP